MKKFFSSTTGPVVLLSLGTFLEYFDLNLFQHMTIIFNQLFFPVYDARIQAIIDTNTFVLPYLLRPLGMIFFGIIGDKYGRKSVIIWTTCAMSISCIVMGSLPTYAEIGISAGILMIICRSIQSFSSGSERVGAEVYLTEITQVPIKFPLVSCISWITGVSAMAALAFCEFILSHETHADSWRYAFYAGAVVAIIGAIARSQLSEPKIFLEHKKRHAKIIAAQKDNMYQKETTEYGYKHFSIFNIPIERSASIAFFFVQCIYPIGSYLLYSHMAFLLKSTYQWTPLQIIQSSHTITNIEFGMLSLMTILSYYVHPLKILKWNFVSFALFMVVYPFLLTQITSGEELHQVRILFGFVMLGASPALPIFYEYFPIGTRLTHSSTIYATARAAMYFITGNVIMFLIDYWNFMAIYVIVVPLTIAYYLGLRYFTKLEIERGHYAKGWLAAQRTKIKFHQ